MPGGAGQLVAGQYCSHMTGVHTGFLYQAPGVESMVELAEIAWKQEVISFTCAKVKSTQTLIIHIDLKRLRVCVPIYVYKHNYTLHVCIYIYTLLKKNVVYTVTHHKSPTVSNRRIYSP